MNSRIRILLAFLSILLFAAFSIGQQAATAPKPAAMCTAQGDCCKGDAAQCADHCKKVGHTGDCCSGDTGKDHEKCAKGGSQEQANGEHMACMHAKADADKK